MRRREPLPLNLGYLAIYGVALVALALVLRELAAERSWPIITTSSGLQLTSSLPYFAAITNTGGASFGFQGLFGFPGLFGIEGPLTIVPLTIAMAAGSLIGGFHRTLIGRIALVSIAVGAGTNATEAWLTSGVVDYIWLEPIAGRLMVLNSSDLALALGCLLLVYTEALKWLPQRTAPERLRRQTVR